MSPAMGGASWVSWIIKIRRREIIEHAIHGGTKRGGGRRRVRRWSKWRSMRFVASAIDALTQYEAISKQEKLAEVGIFRGGKRFDLEQVKAKATQEQQDGIE